MPYVWYDELPEGLEAAEAVAQDHYDALADELAGVTEQRDEALTRLEESRKETRAAKSKYADLILGSNKDTKKEPEDTKRDMPKGTRISDLFA